MPTMKKTHLIVLLVVSISKLKAEIDEKNCEIETNVIESEVNNYRHFRLPQTKEGKCYGACVMKSVSIINSRGKISSRKVEQIAKELRNSQEQAMRFADIKRCSHSANQLNDECETAYNFMKCLSAFKLEKLAKTGSFISISPPTVSVNLPPVTFVLFQLSG
uniref:Odorant binding protein 39 n=1 Tax=Nezara viridula TaxID=85310 RepID=A0A4Y5RDC8_NEZVI|nr:odorant binding protein 39 [Nezara viridula]